ncbi:MAG: hypothetical protein ABW092_18405 [Candidatus Thiodiazotropha sp.]
MMQNPDNLFSSLADDARLRSLMLLMQHQVDRVGRIGLEEAEGVQG